MKFSPFEWSEVPTNATFTVPQGRLRLRFTSPANLFLEAEGVNALVGSEKDFDITIAQEMRAMINDPSERVMAFIYRPQSTAVEFEGEIFTNIDRMNDEGGSMYEVTKAMRLFELEKRNILKTMKDELDQLRAAQAPSDLPEPEPDGSEPDDQEQEPGETL